MKSNDVKVAAGVAVVLGIFAWVPGAAEGFRELTRDYGYVMSFLKFAVLGTFGEVLALRIRTGEYNRPGFGIFPRAFVWGLLGLTIKAAFTIFAVGTPAVLASLGFDVTPAILGGPFSILKLLTSFCVSAAMNCIYAPMLMLTHKVTDMHIESGGGTMAGLFRPLEVRRHLNAVDWNIMWGFVFKKTIPLFWIPCHTITFMLPGDLRVLFAAFLGICLGLILAIAGLKAAKAQ